MREGSGSQDCVICGMRWQDPQAHLHLPLQAPKPWMLEWGDPRS